MVIGNLVSPRNSGTDPYPRFSVHWSILFGRLVLNVLVTGAAGFIGSHLCEYLLGHHDGVVGIDAFTGNYSRSRKQLNVEPLLGLPGFTFMEADLAHAPLAAVLDGVDIVYHLAGQPGVRPSWGRQFSGYVRNNIEATQRLLEHSKSTPLRKFVFASSSSVYGDAERYPTAETARPQPVSPYGVTKLAAEHLCELYRLNFEIPTVSLRLFTVYGPRQRPDMAFSRLIRAALGNDVFQLHGDGKQTRDFTYVADVVRAMRDAAMSNWHGVANIGGGSRTSMTEVIREVAQLGGPPAIVHGPAQHGDVRHTAADISLAAEAFGYRPRTRIKEGLEAMLDWERARLNGAAQVNGAASDW
jgi:nucleoside-diphosphate-sugar epimerase